MQNMYRKNGFKKAIGIICAIVLLVSAIYVPVMVSAADPIPSVEIKDNEAYVFDFSQFVTSTENKEAAEGEAAIGYHGWGWDVRDGVLKSAKNSTTQSWSTGGGFRLHAKLADGTWGFYALEPSARYVVSFKIRVLSSPVTIEGSKETNKSYLNLGYNSTYNSDPASGVAGSYVNGMSTSIKVYDSLIDSNMFTLYDTNGNGSVYACGEDWHTVTYFINTPESFTKDNALAFFVANYHGSQAEIDDVSVTKIGADSGVILLKDEYSATDEIFFGKEGDKIDLNAKDIADRAKDPSHTFEGWYADAGRTEKITEVVFSKTEDKTVYSRWNAPVTVTFKNTLNGTESKVTGMAGDKFAYPEDPVDPDGKVWFMGWYKDAGCTVAHVVPKFGYADETIYTYWKGEIAGLTQDFENYTKDEYTIQTDENGQKYKSNRLVFGATMSKQSEVTYNNSNYAIKYHWNPVQITDKNDHNYYDTSRVTAKDNYFQIGKGLENKTIYVVTVKYLAEKAEAPVNFYMMTANGTNAWTPGQRREYEVVKNEVLNSDGEWHDITFQFITDFAGAGIDVYFGISNTVSVDTVIYFDDIKIEAFAQPYESVVTINTNIDNKVINIKGKRGDKIEWPEMKHPEDAPFKGYYLDKNFTEKYESEVFERLPVVVYARWISYTVLNQGFETYTADQWNKQIVTKNNNTPNDPTDDYTLTYKSNYLIFYTTMSKQSEVVNSGNNAIKFHWNTDKAFDKDVSSATAYNAQNPESYEHSRYSAEDNLFYLGKGLEDNQYYEVTFKYKVEKGNQDATFYMLTANPTNSWGGRKTYTAPENVSIKKTDGWVEYKYAFVTGAIGSNNVAYLGIKLSEHEDVIMYFDDVKISKPIPPYVKFDYGYGGLPSVVYGKVGETIKLPDTPSRVGYDFQGWYLEPECENKFEATAFEEEMALTVYAKWKQSNTYVYSFENYTCTETSGWVLRNGGVSTKNKSHGKNSLRMAYNEKNNVTTAVFALEDGSEMFNLERKREYVVTMKMYIEKFSDSNLSVKFLASAYNNVYVGNNTGKTNLCPTIAITPAEAKTIKGKWVTKAFALTTADLDSDIYTELYCYFNNMPGWEFYIDEVTVRPLAKGQIAVAFAKEGAQGGPDYLIGKPGQSYEKKVPESLSKEGMFFKGYYSKSPDGSFLEKTRGNMVFGEKSEIIFARFLDYEINENFDTGFYNKAYDSGFGYTIHDFDYEVYDSEKEGNSKDNVTSGRYSLHRKGDSMYKENSVILTLGNQFAEGERYTVTFKVKMGKHFHTDGAVKIVSSRSFKYAWTTTGDYYAVVPIADLTDGQWHEVSYTFNSVEAFVTLQTPGYVELFIDDFNFKLVDETVPLTEPKEYTEYVAAERDADGKLLYKDRTAVDISTIIDNSLSAKQFPWIYVYIGGGVVLLGAVALVLILFVFKKKKA